MAAKSLCEFGIRGSAKQGILLRRPRPAVGEPHPDTTPAAAMCDCRQGEPKPSGDLAISGVRCLESPFKRAREETGIRDSYESFGTFESLETSMCLKMPGSFAD